MRSVWSCASCVSLLLSALLCGKATGSHAHAQLGRRHQDPYLHQLAKAQVTAKPNPFKRADEQCSAGYGLCASSLSGGCCPTNYECATDSCYATTAGTSSACGTAGYYNCPASVGGGCCPSGYICGANDCTAPAGVTNTYTSCPASYSLCPASYNYGCCPTTMGCALNACYATTPTSSVVTELFTTTSGGQTIISSTAVATLVTPTAPAGLPTSSNSNIAAKFIPTAVAKTDPISTSSSDGGGLSKGAIGGIVGGIVALLIIVAAIAFFVIRRLNRVAAQVESSRRSATSKTQSRRDAEQYGTHLHTNRVDDYSHPLMSQTPQPVTTISSGSTPQPGGVSASNPTPIPARGRSDSEFSEPLGGYSAFPPTSPDFGRATNLDENGQPAGYFDIPTRVNNMPGGHQQYGSGNTPGMRFSVTSAGDWGHNTHWRNASEASELSADGGSERGGQMRHIPEHVVADMAGAPGTQSPGIGSPLIPAELGDDGVFVPELAAHDRPHHHGHQRNLSNMSAGSGYYYTGTGRPVDELGVVNEHEMDMGMAYLGPAHQGEMLSPGPDDGTGTGTLDMTSPTLGNYGAAPDHPQQGPRQGQR